MIETSVPVEALPPMTGDQFSDMASNAIYGIPVLAEVNDGWALFGPHGVYQDEDGVRVFSDLSRLHKRLREWGFLGFFDGASYRKFEAAMP